MMVRITRKQLLRCFLLIIVLSLCLYITSKNVTQLFEEKTVDWFDTRDEKNEHVYEVCGLKDSDQTNKSKNFPRVITVGSVWNSGLQFMGGLNHWFHSFERLLPHFVNTLRNSYDLFEGDNYNPHNRSTFPNGREEIYLVFSEKWAVSSLGSFGRFSLALLLTAGKYSRIHFAYSDDILIDSNFRVPKPSVQDGSRAAGIVFFDKIAFIRHLSVVFTVDLFQSTHPNAKRDLFRSSSAGNFVLKDVCMYHLQHVPLTMDKVRKRHEWFTSRNEFLEFQTAYSNICQLHPHHHHHINLSYPIPTTASSGSGSGSSSSSSSSSSTISTTNSSVTVMDGYSGHYFGKSSFPLLTQPRPFHPRHPDPKNFVIYQRNSNRRIMDVHFVRKYIEILLISPEERAHKKRFLLTNPSSFSSTTTSSGSSSSSGPVANKDSRSHNTSNHAKKNDSSNGSSNSGNGNNGQKWTVDIVYHDERTRSPCELVDIISKADVLMSSHGFQSLLLLFQPSESLFVELFPYNYYIPTYFGDIQLSLRQSMNLSRYYLGDESSMTSSVLRFLTNVGIFNRENCIHRHVSRDQDIVVSKQFSERIAIFLKTYFL